MENFVKGYVEKNHLNAELIALKDARKNAASYHLASIDCEIAQIENAIRRLDR
jgi:hypothetical protein